MELSADTRTILGLALPTDPRWVDLAALSLEEILTDHAFCEQKAAMTCISLIQRYATHEKLVHALAPIVTEEWGHFRLVLAEIKKRGLKLGRQRKDQYVNALLEFQQKGGDPEGRLLDQLLTMALIEARSCERFKILSEQINDEDLKHFYRSLMESEARHYTTFIGFAKKYGKGIDVDTRWQEFLEFEASLMEKYGRSETMHG